MDQIRTVSLEDIKHEPKRNFRFLVDLPQLTFLVRRVSFPSMTGFLGTFRTEHDQPIIIVLNSVAGTEKLIQDLLSQSNFDVPIWFLDAVGNKNGGWLLGSCKVTLAPFDLDYKDDGLVKYTLMITSFNIRAI